MATKRARPARERATEKPVEGCRKEGTRLKPHIVVRVGRIPGKIEDVVLNGDRSVETALNAAGVSADGEIRVNDKVASLKTQLKKGDCVFVAEDIEGN